jgi:hypothetical protein
MTKNLSTLINLITALALLLGLLAVAYQLWQAQQLTRYEITVSLGVAEHSRFDNQIGENVSTAFSKLYVEPGSLSDAEIVQIISFYDKFYSQITLRQFFREQGLFEYPWQFYVGADTSLLCYYFNNSLGKYWLGEYVQDEIVMEMNDQVSKCGFNGAERLNSARKALSAPAT